MGQAQAQTLPYWGSTLDLFHVYWRGKSNRSHRFSPYSMFLQCSCASALGSEAYLIHVHVHVSVRIHPRISAHPSPSLDLDIGLV